MIQTVEGDSAGAAGCVWGADAVSGRGVGAGEGFLSIEGAVSPVVKRLGKGGGYYLLWDRQLSVGAYFGGT